jgi:hypothetical protein
MGLLDFALKSYRAYNLYKEYMDVGIRHPFVTVKFQDVEIPLLDTKRGVTDPGNELSGRYVQPLFLDSFQHVIRAEGGGGNQVLLRILDPSFDYLEDLLFKYLKTDKDAQLTIEYGYRGKDDGHFTAVPPIPFFINAINLEVFPNRGTLITLDCVDQAIDLHVGSHNASFAEDTPISEVIERCIRKFAPSLDTQIEKILTPVGELNKMEGANVADYIKALLNVAETVTGAIPLFVATIEPPRTASGKAVFTIKSLAPKGPKKTYVFGREKDGEMLEFKPSMNLRAMSLTGASRATSVSIDPLTKTWIRDESTQSEDRTAGPNRAVKTPQTPTENTESPLPPKLTKAANKGSRANSDSVQWQATATLMGDVSLTAYDEIKVIVLKNPPTAGDTEVTNASKNAIHWTSSGVWTIFEVAHHIEGGQFHTRLQMFRNAGFRGSGKDGTPAPFTFDTVDKNLFTGAVKSRVTPLQNRDQLTSSGGVWQPL